MHSYTKYKHTVIHTHTLTHKDSYKHFLSFQLDNDECSTHNCSQICTNTVGTFICGCNIGFWLNNDKVSCNGMQRKLYMYMLLCYNKLYIIIIIIIYI